MARTCADSRKDDSMSAINDLLKIIHDESFSQEIFDMGEQAAAELAAMQERIKELETAMLSIEFDETTGECLLGCGGDSVGGHTDDCIWWKNDTFRGVSNNRLDNS